MPEASAEQRLGAPISYPAELPISDRRADVLAALESHQVVIVAGETGSGKSTQLPKMCLDAGRGVSGMIGHTQPRRIAARSVAERVAEELGVPLGGAVGYKVRFTDRVSDRTLVKVMTDGVLLAELHSDPNLNAYDTLIVDEAHERSLNIDFILGYLKRLMPSRPELKVVITSATIDTQRFSHHFWDAPVIEVSGRAWPVEVRYRPWGEELLSDDVAAQAGEDEEPMDEVRAVCEAVGELSKQGPGDVLVFLAGEREIRDTAEALAKSAPELDIFPLYGRLPSAQQHRIFEPHGGRRVVLATNVAETSITVPGVRYVVDTGVARISRYSRRTKVQRLPIEPVSQASANQRAGRCGRLGPGICIRLYPEADFASRPEFAEPEILRTNLASVVLQMAAIGLGDPEDFPFIDPPDRRSLKDGALLLEELGAMVPAAPGPSRLTNMGRKLASLPLDPRLGRMVLEASRLGCLDEVLVIAAGLSVQDPRERPPDKKEAASQLHSRFDDPTSDFLSVLALWRYLEARQGELSSSQFRRMCRREMISYQRAREWQDVYTQLSELSKRLKLPPPRPSQAVAGNRWRVQVHQAVLAGITAQVGLREGERQDYAAPRGARFAIWPGSVLAKKRPRWVMAAELVETGRLWGRVVAPVRPQWVERAASHLLNWSYGETSWDSERGEAFVLARASLYGLPVVPGRRVGLGRMDVEEAHEHFLVHALVEGDWEGAPDFVKGNLEVLEQLRALAQRARRHELEAGEAALLAFYRARVPREVGSGAAFLHWWAGGRRRGVSEVMRATPEELAGPALASVGLSGFPDVWPLPDGGELALRYRWSPGSQDDGVTVEVPLRHLGALGRSGLEWQVTGLREELVEALLRSLPKELRRPLVPLGEHARRFVALHGPADGPLLPLLGRSMAEAAQAPIGPEDFEWSKVPSYLRPTYEVVGPRGEELARAKEVPELFAQLTPRAERVLRTAASVRTVSWGPPGRRMSSWEIGSLPRAFEVDWYGWRLRAYPSLMDRGDAVSVELFGDEASASLAMAGATRRLLQMNTPSLGQLAGNLERRLGNQVKLALASLGGLSYRSGRELAEDLVSAAIDAVAGAHGGPPWDAASFARLNQAARSEAEVAARKSLAAAERMIAKAQELSRRLAEVAPRVMQASVEDIRAELTFLCGPGFLSRAGLGRLGDIERYLSALERRLEKLPLEPGRDASLAARARSVQERVERAAALADSQMMGEAVRHQLRELRWLVEELRVSFFAQSLGTKRPVSEERLGKAIERALAG